MPARVPWICIVACVLAIPGTGTAADRPAAEAIYAQYQADSAVDAGWTGSTQTCAVGEESSASLAATLRTVNGVRALMGASSVTFDPEYNRQALAAALMMRANNQLSHFPRPEWQCYSDAGYQGASQSNLYLGRSGAGAIIGYMHDEGVYSLGHRLWIADPGQRTLGSGSTGSSNALFVLASDREASTAPTAWPPPGWIPGAWVPQRWSYTVRPSCGCVVGDVAVAVARDGAPVAVGEISLLGQGYGSGTTVAWEMPPEAVRFSGDAAFSIRITGVRPGGVSAPIEYAIKVFAPASPPSADPAGPGDEPERLDWRGGLSALRVERKGRMLTIRYVATQAGRLRVRVSAQQPRRTVAAGRASRSARAGSGALRIRLKPAHVRPGTRLYITAGLDGVEGALSRTLRVR